MHKDELGKEFWGMLLFETHIVHLYQLLNVQKYDLPLFDFVDWLVFTNNIPYETQKSFYSILQNRFRLAQYQNLLPFYDHVVELKDDNFPIIRPLTAAEKEINDIAVELLKLKYQNRYLKPSSFNAIYNLLSYNYFSVYLHRFIENSFIDRYVALDYLIYFKIRDCAV